MSEESRPTTWLDIGTVLAGRYIVEQPISAGAMGTVNRAHDRETGEIVAIKRLTDLTNLARFEIEARLLAMLDHPRVVHVRDHFSETTGYYLVMELVEGSDLAEILKREGAPGLPVDRVLDYAEQSCEALDYVHQQRIVHRDVKPHNLIIDDRGVVLVDFGVARRLTDAAADHESGTIGVGTPRFMAPEIFAGGAVSERSDVFSLAATVFTLIVGELPVYGDRRPLSSRVPGISADLDVALRSGMEFLPERRIATIAALARALGRPLKHEAGLSFARSVPQPEVSSSLMEAIVHAAAGVFDAAAASIALTDEQTGELTYQAAWGAGADEIVGVRLPRGAGISGHVVVTGEPVFVAECRRDSRFAAAVAAGTGYVPVTMLVVPLKRSGDTIGVLSLLDRRDGGSYDGDDVSRASLFAELALTALELGPKAFSDSRADDADVRDSSD